MWDGFHAGLETFPDDFGLINYKPINHYDTYRVVSEFVGQTIRKQGLTFSTELHNFFQENMASSLFPRLNLFTYLLWWLFRGVVDHYDDMTSNEPLIPEIANVDIESHSMWPAITIFIKTCIRYGANPKDISNFVSYKRQITDTYASYTKIKPVNLNFYKAWTDKFFRVLSSIKPRNLLLR